MNTKQHSKHSCRVCGSPNRTFDENAPSRDPFRKICSSCNACACDECFNVRPLTVAHHDPVPSDLNDQS